MLEKEFVNHFNMTYGSTYFEVTFDVEFPASVQRGIIGQFIIDIDLNLKKEIISASIVNYKGDKIYRKYYSGFGTYHAIELQEPKLEEVQKLNEFSYVDIFNKPNWKVLVNTKLENEFKNKVVEYLKKVKLTDEKGKKWGIGQGTSQYAFDKVTLKSIVLH